MDMKHFSSDSSNRHVQSLPESFKKYLELSLTDELVNIWQIKLSCQLLSRYEGKITETKKAI